MNATSKPKDSKTSKVAKTKRLLESYVQGDRFLARLEKSVLRKEFRATLEETKEEESVAGRRGCDKLTLSKRLILQEANSLSDKALESTLKDRLGFRFFTGIGLSPTVPVILTVMRFRNRLTTNALHRRLFTRFTLPSKNGDSLYMRE